MDKILNKLNTINQQFRFYMNHTTAMKNNLVALLNQTYPGANVTKITLNTQTS